MKTKIMFAVVLATFFTAPIIAQTKTSFGIRGGVNFQNINGENINGDKFNSNKLKTGFNAGVNAEIPVGIDFYLQPGLLYSTKGTKREDLDATTNLSYLEMPVNFLYKPSLGEGRLLLGFGPYAAYALSAKAKVGDIETDIEFGEGGLKRFDAGANLLAGYEFRNKLSFQLNAGLGLVNIYDRSANDNNSIWKNTGFGVSLGYRFN